MSFRLPSALRGTSLACIGLLLLSISGCGALQGAKNMAKSVIFPTVENLKITTQSDSVINPDDRGAALPVTVRIYQLDEVNQMLHADYAALLDNDQAVLGTSLLQRYEYIAYPQSTSVQEFPIKPSARYIAVLAVMRKPPAPAYYLLDATSIRPSGIALQVSAGNVVMTSGPTPYNQGTEGGVAAPTPPAAFSPPAVKPSSPSTAPVAPLKPVTSGTASGRSI